MRDKSVTKIRGNQQQSTDNKPRQSVYKLIDSYIFKFDFACRLCGICLILR